MQDNYENGVDEPLVDRGWEEMRRLLDKEMPVAPATTKPSRRILPMWWLAAACITAIAVGGAFYWNVDNTPPGLSAQAIADNAVPVQTPFAEEEKMSTAGVVNVNPSSLGGNNIQSEKPILLFNKRQAAINTLQAPVQSTTITTTQENTSSVVFLDKKQQDSAADASLETTTATLNETPAPAAIDVIPGISHAFIVSPNPALDAAASALKASPSWLPDNLALSTGIISGDYAPVDGFQVGVDAQYALGGKWSLVSSPAYRFQRQSLTLEVEASTIASGPIALDDQLGVFAESVSPTNNFAPTTTYYTALKNHYVDVPIQIAYQVGTRFRLEAGPSFSYLAGVYEGSPFGNSATADMQISSFYPTTASRSWYSAEADDKLNPVYFNRLDIGVNLGVTYRPTQWLGLRLQYRQGFVDMLKTQAYELRNRHLALSTLVFF